MSAINDDQVEQIQKILMKEAERYSKDVIVDDLRYTDILVLIIKERNKYIEKAG